MTRNSDKHQRTFVLKTSHVYVPGELPKQTHGVAPKNSGGGCCGSDPVSGKEESSDCGAPDSSTDSTGQQSSSCC